MHCDVRCPCLVIAVYSTGATGRAIVLSPFRCVLLVPSNVLSCFLNTCTRSSEYAFLLSEPLATSYPVKSDRFDRAQDGDTSRRQFRTLRRAKYPIKEL